MWQQSGWGRENWVPRNKGAIIKHETVEICFNVPAHLGNILRIYFFYKEEEYPVSYMMYA